MRKRSFKIATAFAGTVAATMGLGPAALAATALPASHRGSIRNQLCSQTPLPNGISHWLHIYYPRGANGAPIHDPECFGFKGWTTAGAVVWSACTGNNQAQLYFSDASVDPLSPSAPIGPVNFIRGTGHQTSAHLTKVSIFRWSGHATCPPIN